MDISIIITNYNYSKYLNRSIRSAFVQNYPEEKYEIIVVDNKSTDNTEDIVLDNFSNVSNLKYIYESVLGLSQARNTGWKNAKGQYVAYLDDDAVARFDWLEKILHVFNTVYPKPACVGGKIEPLWGKPRPPWISDEIIGCLGVIDWSDKPIFINEQQWLSIIENVIDLAARESEIDRRNHKSNFNGRKICFDEITAVVEKNSDSISLL